MKSKAQWRENSQPVFNLSDSGKLAQKLRGVKSYRESRQVFISPAPFLSQVRINALLDGKELVMPGPGLKQGFFLVKPFSIPFPKLSFGVSLGGISQYGSIIPPADIAQLEIGVFLSEALLINPDGVRIGDGSGFFDLGVAIINEYGGGAERYDVLAALADISQLISEELPADPWDIPVQGVVTCDEHRQLKSDNSFTPKVHWEELAPKTIKKIDPLWKLSCDVLKETHT